MVKKVASGCINLLPWHFFRETEYHWHPTDFEYMIICWWQATGFGVGVQTGLACTGMMQENFCSVLQKPVS